jgi:hypothetical protein
MTSAAVSSRTLVPSSLDHPDARNLGDQLDGELASIYGGLTTGRDVKTGRTQPTDRKRSVRCCEACRHGHGGCF